MSLVNALPPTRVRTIFRIAAFAEAASWAGLLIGMYVKYLGSGSHLGVAIFGPIHGALFIVYGIAALLAWRTFRWTPVVGIVALIAAVPPFTTVVFELWADRTGRLEVPAAETALAPEPR